MPDTEQPDVDAEVRDWCGAALGAVPVAVLHRSDQMSSVLGLRLEDGREVAVKTRPDEPAGRAAACVGVQRRMAEAGLPVARPVTDVHLSRAPDGTHDLARHAEEWRPGGEMLRDDGPDAARRCGTAYADLMAALAAVDPRPSIVRPPWVDWDHDGPGVFPSIPFVDERDQSAVPAGLMEAAGRAKELLRSSGLPDVVGHADFEAQNLRWHGGTLWCIHDFDSIGTGAEAAFVGAAAGAFASQETPTLAPLASSRAFLEAYQEARGRAFNALEQRVAWAAGLWPAVWNARAEALFGHPPVTTSPLIAQLHERVALAGLVQTAL